ncbi:MAG: hypothetical protein AB8G15_09500 [Saprospiraceae bacterium]
MKNYYVLPFALFFLFSFVGCDDFDDECIADVAVEVLDAPGAVLSGNLINVVCVIKNIINTASNCTSSGEGTVTVSCGYRKEFSNEFVDYEIFEERTTNIDSYRKGEGQEDLMQMPTDFGAGFYAMKVAINYPNDTRSNNDSKAVSIRAD